MLNRPTHTTSRSEEREVGCERFHLVPSGYMTHGNLNTLYGPLTSYEKFYNFIEGHMILPTPPHRFRRGASDVQSDVNGATSDYFRDRVYGGS